jgi:Fur family ferric uptake transcriptional regulator
LHFKPTLVNFQRGLTLISYLFHIKVRPRWCAAFSGLATLLQVWFPVRMTVQTPLHFDDLLRSHGLKATPQRLLVLKLLAAQKKPASIAELKKRAGRNKIDNVTLYRSLDSFVEKSLVRPVDLRHGHTDYELVTDPKHHHHIVCENCGKIEEFEWCPDAGLESRLLKKTSNFAKLSDHSLEFFGLCKTCEKRR